MTTAPASVTVVRFRRWMSDSGVSRGTRISFRRSFNITSAARSTKERLDPVAMALTVPMEQGQITIPSDLTDPDAGLAPRSASSKTVTDDQSPPVRAFSALSLSIPVSVSSSRQPCPETMSQVGTLLRASTSSSRTAYGAPEAPVMARMSGSDLMQASRKSWEFGVGRGGR